MKNIIDSISSYPGIEGLVMVVSDYRDFVLIGAEVVATIITFIIVYYIARVSIRHLSSISVGSESGENSDIKIQKAKYRTQGLLRALYWLFFLTCLVTCTAIVALNGYYLYQGEDIFTHTLNFIENIPPDYWSRLAVIVAKIAGMAALAWFIIRLLSRILSHFRDKALAYERIKTNDESITTFFNSLNKIQTNGIRLFIVALAAGMLDLPAAIEGNLYIILKIYLIISIGFLVVSAVTAIVESIDALSRRYTQPGSWLASYERMCLLVPMLRRTLEYIIYVVATSLILLQLDFVSELAKYGPSIVEAIGIVFITRVVKEISELLIDKAMVKGEGTSDLERQREQTLIPIIKNLIKYTLYFIAFVLILRAIDVNPWPLLAGAGIVGVVIGLGAQPLINDILAGFFILFENLFLAGDYIEVGNARGEVERVDIRTTSIRNPNGQLHILRNGEISEVMNYSKGYTNAVVEVGVSYDSNLDFVYKVLEDTGKKLREENPNVLLPTVIDGLSRFGESELTIRTTTRVRPANHGIVARHFRKLIKEAFDREGIEIPFARRVFILKTESKNETDKGKNAMDENDILELARKNS